MNAYNMRDAGAVMHSHSQNVVLASMIMGSEFKCSHIEMIKGIKKGNTGVRNQLKIPYTLGLFLSLFLTVYFFSCKCCKLCR